MFAGVLRICFEADARTAQDAKALKALASDIAINFDVSALGSTATLEQGDLYICVSALSHVENNLNQKFDKIILYCEKSGFGRVEDETRFLDSISAMDMDEDEDEDEDDDQYHGH